MFELTISDAIAHLVLNRPKTLNAVPVQGWIRLASAADEAVRSGARVLVLGGTPAGAFCAGADILEFDAFLSDPQARSAFRQAMRRGLDTVRDLPIPTIALVEGVCFGAGVALAMACDIRVAGPAARFAVTPAKLGISYPQEDVHRLVSLVGQGQAARLLFGARTIGVEEAARIGLVEVTAEKADETARDLAQAIAANGAESLRILKRGIGLAAMGARQDDEQDRMFDAMLGSEELLARLAAHRSRRK